MITFDPDSLRSRVAELERRMGQPGFWDDQAEAAKVSAEHSRLARRLERYDQLTREYDDARELLSLDGEMADEIATALRPLRAELDRLQEDALFTGEYDTGDALMSLHAATGGIDAQDFTEMLLRMYLRWADDRGFKSELLEATPGEEAGLKSATLALSGENASGILKAERGKHRLVRLSPFDQAHRRHTSFAQVVVAPLLPEDAAVELDESELRIDTYRASGAGGQHVNKTDSAVRITHVPTGIVVQCQNERSQTANKQTALRMLRSRLAELQLEEREAEIARERGEAADTGFGGANIRSYVLQPYQQVKDHRTGHEVGNAQGVLDGDIDGFIHAYLLAQATGAPLGPRRRLRYTEPEQRTYRRGLEAACRFFPVTELETTPPAVVEAPENGARPTPAGAAIVFDAVTKVYEPGVTALSDVSFVIEKGEFVFVVGASGSGKSTMIRLILKELEPTSGRIIVGGRDLSRLRRSKVPQLRRNVGCVFQDFKLLPNRTAAENVAYALKVQGEGQGSIRRKVPEVLNLVGLAHKMNSLPDELSGGEQQRVSIARAFVNHPPLLICDEPTGNLDPDTSVGIMQLLYRINRSGTTILMVTHDREMVDKMRRRVLALADGKLERDERRGGYVGE